MANLTITTVTPALVYDQVTAPASEAITLAQYVRLSTAGKLEPGNGTDATESAKGGVALSTVGAGETVTMVTDGYLDVGNALTAMAFNASVYLSDTDGTLATTAGTVSRVVGRVVAAWGATSADKLLRVEMGG